VGEGRYLWARGGAKGRTDVRSRATRPGFRHDVVVGGAHAVAAAGQHALPDRGPIRRRTGAGRGTSQLGWAPIQTGAPTSGWGGNRGAKTPIPAIHMNQTLHAL
jgi:hypothetical protein